nr:MAG TPA: proteasome-activating nucleotidase [Caudoviricetes sp.]
MTHKPTLDEIKLKSVDVESNEDLDVVKRLYQKENNPHLILLYKKLLDAMESAIYYKELSIAEKKEKEDLESEVSELERDVRYLEQENHSLQDDIESLKDELKSRDY